MNISLNEFLQVDDSLATCGTLTDTEIVENVKGASEDEEEEAEEHIDVARVTAKEAEKAVELLTTFLESQENVGEDGFNAISTLRKIVETKTVRRQKTLKDYFC